MTFRDVIIAIGCGYLAMQLIVLVAAIREVSARCAGWRARCHGGAYRWVPRSQAILDVERALSTAPMSGILRRLGVTAPLLGVVLTTGAVMSVGGQEALRQVTVDGVLPLITGVLAGAVLAVVNQGLVAVLSWYTDRTLQRAIEQVSSMDVFRESGDVIEALIADLRTAASVLGASIESVGALAGRVGAAMESVTSGAELATERLAEVSTRLAEVVSGPAKDFQASSERMRGAAEDFSAKLLRASDTVGSSMGRIESRVESALAIQQLHFDSHSQAAMAITSASEELAEAAGSACASIETVSSRFVKTLSESQEAVVALQRQLSASFAVLEGLAQQRARPDQPPNAADSQLASVIRGLADATRAMERLAADAKASSRTVRGVLSGLFRPGRP